MNVKRWELLCLLLVLSLTLSGCVPTPQAMVDDGVTRAMSDVEITSSGTVNSGLLPFEEIKEQNGREIDTVLTGEDGATLTIKAKVIVAQVDEAPLLALKDATVDMELAKRAFLGERAEEATISEIYDTPGSIRWELPPEPGQEWGACVDWVVYSENRGARLFYYGNGNSEILTFEEGTAAFDETACGNLLDDILSQLGLDISGYTLYQSNKDEETGEYTIWYVPQYGPFPVVPDQAAIAIGGEAVFSKDSLTDFSLVIPKCAVQTGVMDEMLGVDQALEVVKAYLGTDLLPRPDKAVEQIMLCNRYVQDQTTGEYSTCPVWMFYMTPDPMQNIDFDDPDLEEKEYLLYDESFVVDARSGLLEVVSTSMVEVT